MHTHTPPRGSQGLGGTAGGAHRKRPVKAISHGTSTLQSLEGLVACESIWRMVERFEAFHNSAARRGGPGRQYTFMDVVVMEAATQLYVSRVEAARNLGDPLNWARLCRAAVRAFPNDPKRRLSQRAPSLAQCYRARREYFCGEGARCARTGPAGRGRGRREEYGYVRPCGCRKLCRGWSGSIAVLVDESVGDYIDS